jgi:hypothetical protein
MTGEKIVLLLGAGASVADVATKPLKSRPPLDRRFFAVAASASRDLRVEVVAEYLRDTYDIDILSPEYDSLEGVMARLYPDLFNPLLEASALPAFRALLRLFTDRLARTTNDLRATQKRLLYRMLSGYLATGLKPEDITIITFNQDLQVEKTLELLSKTKRWEHQASSLFSFPWMYSVADGTWERVTGPSGAPSPDDLFARMITPEPDRLRVLKLHGSLNWYSTHTSTSPSRSAMFNPKRRLSVTRRRTIAPDMTLSGTRKVYTLPVVVPPVNHKSAVLHQALGDVWTLAEQRLVEADSVVIFGYSCPALDFESSNLLRRAQLQRSGSGLSVIDPDGAVASRYVNLLGPARLNYYRSAHEFLG